MPNHIKNRLTLSGDQSKINELVARFSTFHAARQHESYDGGLTFENQEGNFGWLKDGVFSTRIDGEIVEVGAMPEGFVPSIDPEFVQFPDFKKVIPSPDGLEITSDGLVMYIENEFSARDTMSQLKDAIKKASIESVENFCKAIVNFKKYGFACWYDWQSANWGTKWNSYSCEKKEGNVWEFDTAWNGVPKIVSEISKAFPEIEIVYEYSDEDTGSNCGTNIYEDGELKETNIPENGSNEAYDLAFKLRPEYAESYHLVNGVYEYKDDE